MHAPRSLWVVLAVTSGTVLSACVPSGEKCVTAECLLAESNGQTQGFSGTDGLPPIWPGTVCASEEDEQSEKSSPTFHFEIDAGKRDGSDFFRLPFPNDIRLGGGGIDLEGFPTPPPEFTAAFGDIGMVVDRWINAVADDTDGYAVNTGVVFRSTVGIDTDAGIGVGSGGGIRFINVDSDSADYGDQVNGVSFRTSSGPGSRGTYICQNWLGVEALDGLVLDPDTTYAVVLTNQIKPKGGGNFAQDSDFATILSDADPGGDESTAWSRYAPLRDFIKSGINNDPAGQNLRKDEILVAAVFTTGPHRNIMAAARSAVRAQAFATTDLTLCDAAGDSPCSTATGLSDEEAEARRCAAPDSAFDEIHGRVTLPIFQTGEAPYVSSGGKIEMRNGAPQKVRDEDVCFAMTVPKGTPPANGWPLLVYGHGTGGGIRAAASNGVAARAAAEGFATITLDGSLHGERRNDTDNDGLVEELDVDQLVFNFQNPDSARDTLIQGAIDKFTAARFAEDFSDDTVLGTTVSFDAANVMYMGHSQGANAGIPFLAYEPLVKAAVLSGGGSNLLKGLLAKTKPEFAIPGTMETLSPAELLQVAFMERSGLTSFHPVLMLLNTFVNRSDGDVYAPQILANPAPGMARKHLLHYTGHVDNFTPLRASGSLAIASGVRIGGQNLFQPPCDDHQGVERQGCKYTTNGFLPETTLPASGNRTFGSDTVTAINLQRRQSGSKDGHFVALESDELGRLMGFLSSALDGAVPTVD